MKTTVSSIIAAIASGDLLISTALAHIPGNCMVHLEPIEEIATEELSLVERKMEMLETYGGSYNVTPEGIEMNERKEELEIGYRAMVNDLLRCLFADRRP